ncbi:MAG: RidA family protein [Phaeodactylibacter sp.]|nr:RidA family protein [Phaeodactylibacter sp.]
MPRKTLNPKTLFNSTNYGFSQIAIAPAGKLVFISGQVAWDEHLNIVGAGDLKRQTQKAIDNLKIAIEATGGTLDNIMMLRIYKVNYQREDGPIINSVLKETFGTEHPPASTWVSVQGLANEDFLIEIEAQAVI